MAYSDFKLDELVKRFELTIEETSELFGAIAEVECSDLLITTLRETVDLAVAINTEKARSELIIAPVLLELRRQFNRRISLFSGIDFTVDASQGLNGVCDFIISESREQLFIRAPVLTVVEAKNENLKSGFAQCIAEMIGAQIFNDREGNQLSAIHGVVTIGTVWRFLKLKGQTVELDLSEYYIKDIKKILGILSQAILNSS
jgi:hypothetical protein